jgi:hypothetical protein
VAIGGRRLNGERQRGRDGDGRNGDGEVRVTSTRHDSSFGAKTVQRVFTGSCGSVGGKWLKIFQAVR